MKIIKIKQLIPLSISIVALAFTASSWAAGTAANTSINNTATLSYSVGTGNGTAQTVIESSEAGNSTPGLGGGSATTFIVDKKIDLLVTAGSGVNVVPGTDAQAMTFTLVNEGNSEETFSFLTNQITSPSTTAPFKFEITTCNNPANITLAADASQTITVNCNIPDSSTSVTNTSTSQIDLKATAVGVTETSGNDTAGTMDIVFADNTGTSTDGADRNASHSAINTYTVNTADLTVKKTSEVVSMSINTGTATTPTTTTITAANGAKRIPGATIEYTITVSNAGSAPTTATATGVVISDKILANITYSSCSVSGDGISSCDESGGVVSSTAFDLAPGKTAILKILAVVN